MGNRAGSSPVIRTFYYGVNMIGIIGALEAEVNDLKNIIEGRKEKVVSGLTF